MSYTFTNTWFKGSELRSYIHQALSPVAENRILEIGTFEGQSTLFFADIYCSQHPNSFIVSVDPFDMDDQCTPMTSAIETTFLNNIAECPNNSKIIVKRQYSDDFFKENTRRFNFIYIDGSHVPEQIVKDATAAFEVLDLYGILWFDDYLGGHSGENSIRNALDKWVLSMDKKLNIVFKGYQLGCQKVAE